MNTAAFPLKRKGSSPEHLKRIIIPESVKALSLDRSFFSCSQLETFKLPKDLEILNLETRTFGMCHSMKDFFKREFKSDDKLLDFFKNPDFQLKLEIEKNINKKYHEIIKSEFFIEKIKPFYDSLISNFL